MSVVLRMTICARAGALARPAIESRTAKVIVRVGAAHARRRFLPVRQEFVGKSERNDAVSFSACFRSLVGKSRRDAMFIEKLEPIDPGEPIHGRTIVGCAPKGATTSQLCLPFYRHFTATRFFRQIAKAGCE
ncbi:MAG: hypothetical protein DMF75_05155 [Acidobacteria bacterium]|nr:MAG: hypothetical protein DMF75_05155 [Acidobacteriota bacterium]